MTNAPARRVGMLALALAIAGPAAASDIRVAPVLIDPLPGARTTSLTLVNAEQRPVRVQVRVMRWTAPDGVDTLVPADGVVASPPFANLSPQQQYLVRVVRTAKSPPVGEESYRVLIDEVPDPAAARPGTVNLVVRQSIPAFFSDIPRRTPDVTWHVETSDDGATLVGRNRGTRRLRLADLAITGGGRRLFDRAGLVGYVLAGSQFRLPLGASVNAGTAGLRMTALSDGGALDLPLVVQPAQ